jgi:hypothetical protein
MIKSFFGELGKGVRRVVRPVGGIIQKYRQKRQVSQAMDEAFRLEHDGSFAAAAAIYTRLAGEYIQSNPLIYQLYSHDSFNLWLQAKNVETALGQAGDVLRLLADTGWLSQSSDAVDDLSKMVGELYVAGYVAQAGALSEEINQQLKTHGVAPVALQPGQFPSICPQCGGALPSAAGTAEIKCPYCGSIIHAA